VVCAQPKPWRKWQLWPRLKALAVRVLLTASVIGGFPVSATGEHRFRLFIAKNVDFSLSPMNSCRWRSHIKPSLPVRRARHWRGFQSLSIRPVLTAAVQPGARPIPWTLLLILPGIFSAIAHPTKPGYLLIRKKRPTGCQSISILAVLNTLYSI